MLDKLIINFRMSRYRLFLSIARVYVDVVIGSVSKKATSLLL